MSGSIGVVGAGTMGSDIALACLAAGWHVRLVDVDAQALEAGRARIVEGLERAVAKERMSGEVRDAALGRLRIVAVLPELADGVDIVIEAASERLEIKEHIFSELDRVSAAETVLATNTSSLTVAACARQVRRPGRVIGLHFFNPVARMELVEVASTTETDTATLEAGLALVSSLGKTAVHCADAPGFIVNRVGRPYVLEALRMLEGGEGGVASIDAALESAGYPMGPFRLMDLIGLDIDLAINRSLYHAFGEAPRFKPSALQSHLVADERLGRKAGRGFYRYEPGQSPVVDAGVEADLPSVEPPPAGASGASAALSDAEIVERLELAVINEAYRAVEEGVAAPTDVDVAMRLGARHPIGPFERAGVLGLKQVVTRLHELQQTTAEPSADQYEVAASLWQVATV